MKVKQLILGSLLCAVTLASVSNEGFTIQNDNDIAPKQKKHKSSNTTFTKEPDDKLYIHLIPHSHNDVGWLKTVDEYYYGSNTNSQWAAIQYIFETVLDELLKDPTRKYIQVETAYLYRWWIDSPENRRKQYKKMVDNGQIEFVNGGWCMNDEATPYYEDIIDQMTIGHLWLKQQFGEKGIPSIGWHIDPFGHQSTNAALFSQMGFNGWWFARIDYQDKEVRLNRTSMEMIWSPYQASGEDNSIFSAVNYNHYAAPTNFGFDTNSRDEPIMDNPRLEGYNIDTKSVEFVQYFKNMSANFRSNHLLHTMGNDFTYVNAIYWYKNMDKLISYINSHKELFNVEILYSTPAKYLALINKQKIAWPTKVDDFFPYADKVNSYWTGYFTSRVALKGNVRDTGRYLQHIRNIFSVTKLAQSSKFLKDNYELFLSHLDSFEQNMAILQHHDAVSGTEKTHVANDYVKRLQNSTDRINEVLHPILEEQALREISEKVKYSQCRWNATANNCTATYNGLISGKTILLNVYNPTVSRPIVVKIKVPHVSFSLIDQDNKDVYGEVFCLNKFDRTDCDLYFEDHFDGYSYRYYKLVPGEGEGKVNQIFGRHISFLKKTKKVNISDKVTLTVNRFTTHFILETCSKKHNSEDIEKQVCTKNTFEILYYYYPSYQGDGQKSGAYIFRPDLEHITSPTLYSETRNQYIYQGKLLSIVRLEGNHTDTQLRVYANDYYKHVVELETFIDSIPILDGIGKEVVLLVDTPFSNNETFYTDSNGLELQKRILNYRPTWNLSVSEPAAGNYYPINGMITIQDIETKKRFSVVNDRAQGGASLEEGQIEIMIHRRLQKDDARGVLEVLNEVEPNKTTIGLTQRVRHYLVFEEGDQTLSRKFQNHVDNYPLIFQSVSDTHTFKNLKFINLYNPLKINIDPFLKVYFKPFGDDYLLRLYNLNDQTTTSFNLLQGLEIVEEVILTATKSKEKWEKQKYHWQTETNTSTQSQSSYDKLLSKVEKALDGKLYIKPLELRTFIVKFNASSLKNITQKTKVLNTQSGKK